ncbi:hypothetical protein [Serpentinicella alkaliphila]|uniref:Uncharacterized protein n=1 Tax=Serpentinicella alkaliphila TaxID=1734049 RepID=A0A4R2T9P7_9FIRM|nr:hypothetical protein [Serpentinicella alkaliphila]QUH24778.1 hypothetical protein HZR23_02520 [Serpentinicella alkaliphila]TCP98995.1 hypothetical protein EDD79_103928 [Serpentinicella alkaliphila]
MTCFYIYNCENSKKVDFTRDSQNMLNDIRSFQLLFWENSNICLNIICDGPETVLSTYDPQLDEWVQFSFRFCNNYRGIELLFLILPDYLKRKGLGTFCVTWFKEFCYKYGFQYIILRACDKAVNFWIKMEFSKIECDDEIIYLRSYSNLSGFKNVMIDQKTYDKKTEGNDNRINKVIKRTCVIASIILVLIWIIKKFYLLSSDGIAILNYITL